jgi:hypothetical protein
MPHLTNCSSEQAKWPFLNLSRASSSATIISGAMKRPRDVIREKTVRPVAASDSQTKPRFVILLPITHTPPDGDTIGIEIPAKVKQTIGLDDARSWVIVSEHNIDEWPNAGLSPLPGKPGVFGYGFIPPGLFAQIKARFLELARQNKSGAVRR